MSTTRKNQGRIVQFADTFGDMMQFQYNSSVRQDEESPTLSPAQRDSGHENSDITPASIMIKNRASKTNGRHTRGHLSDNNSVHLSALIVKGLDNKDKNNNNNSKFVSK